MKTYNKLKKDELIELLRGSEIESIPNISEYRCSHRKQKYYCKECGGKGICEHGRSKYTCKECGGGGICEHGIQKTICKECGGSHICPHKKTEKFF